MVVLGGGGVSYERGTPVVNRPAPRASKTWSGLYVYIYTYIYIYIYIYLYISQLLTAPPHEIINKGSIPGHFWRGPEVLEC